MKFNVIAAFLSTLLAALSVSLLGANAVMQAFAAAIGALLVSLFQLLRERRKALNFQFLPKPRGVRVLFIIGLVALPILVALLALKLQDFEERFQEVGLVAYEVTGEPLSAVFLGMLGTMGFMLGWAVTVGLLTLVLEIVAVILWIIYRRRRNL